MTDTKSQMTATQQNSYVRDLIFSSAKPISQKIASKSISGPVTTDNNVLTFNPLQVGFLRRFVVVVSGTLTNTHATAAASPSPFGADNLLTNITFSDFTGNPRHNASGRFFSAVEAAKNRRIPGAAIVSDGSVSGYGSNIASNVLPSTLAAGANGIVRRVFEIPIMQTMGKTMTGGMWLGVNNQSTLLQLTLTPTAFVASGDPLRAIMTGASGTLTNVNIEVYQDYWNDVPYDKTGMPILPLQDIANAYMINENNSGISFATGQMGSWNYPTFSSILSTVATYWNGSSYAPGTDIDEISLRVSNYSIIKQASPFRLSRDVRNLIGADLPLGMSGIFTRMHPLNVSQYPSLQLTMTPNTVSDGAYALIGTEFVRQVQLLASASGTGGS